MDPYMPMTNSTALLPWVRLMLLLRGVNPQQAIDARLVETGARLTRSMYSPATPNRPGFYYGQFDLTSYLLIDGATTIAQATLLTTGYLGRNPPTIRNPQNEYLNDGVTEIVQAIRDNGFGGPTNIRIGGYSLGGAMAPIVPFEINRTGWGTNQGNIITFGAPKVHGFRPNQVLDVGRRCTRLMNDDDPVPLFCPSVLDYPALLALVGPVHGARLSNFDHPGRGTIISREGVLSEGTVPTPSTLNFGANLANWLLSTEQGQDNQHALAEYEKRLILMEQNNARAVHIPQANVQRQEQVQRNEMNQVEGRVVEAVAHAGFVQGHDPVILPKDKIFKWVRIGRINGVMFGEKLVVITNTKKRALRLANSGNDFLRVMQRMAMVDPISMGQQFHDYLVIAQQATAGFHPPLQTQFPTIGN